MDEALRRPRRKPKASLHLLESPLPVPIETITGKTCNDKRWYYYFGKLESDHVSVSRMGDLTFLYRLGFFGRGAFSRSQPQFEKYKDVLSDQGRKGYMQHFLSWEPEERVPQQQVYIDIIKERLRQHELWTSIDNNEKQQDFIKICMVEEEMKKDDQLLQCADLHTDVDNLLVEEASSESDDPELYADKSLEKSSKNDENETINNESDLVGNKNSHSNIDNSNGKDTNNEFKDLDSEVTACSSRKRSQSPFSDNIDKKIKLEDSYKLLECLQLTFEEAFFLSYGLGCLSISDRENHALSTNEMWSLFTKVQSNFIQMYVAYHHFRSKGWVVRFSKIYGLDFVLYQDGVAFHHASYCVIVKLVYEDTYSSQDAQLSWQQIGAMCRINERAGKEVLFCYVVQPKGMSDYDLLSPSCIKKFKVMEVVLRRWAPERFREVEK